MDMDFGKGKESRRAQVEINGSLYSLLIDSGSREFSYIKREIVEKHNLITYEANLTGVYADGRQYNCTNFTSLKIKIKLENKILQEIFVKTYVLDEIPCDVIIGRTDIFHYDLYKVMKAIDTCELNRNINADDETSYVEWAQLMQLYKLDGAEGVEYAQPPSTSFASMVTERSAEELDELLRQAHEEKRRDREIQEAIDHLINVEFKDQFCDLPPKEPARVPPQVIKLVTGVTLDTIEGVKRFPAVMRGQQRRHPQEWIDRAGAKIQMLLEQGVITHSNSPVHNPIHLEPKGDGDTRFCLDASGLNSVCVRENFPIQGLEDFIAWLNPIQAVRFCKIDFSSMYFQLPLAEESQRLLAFKFGPNQFQFTRVVMGTSNAVAHAQQLMVQTVFLGLVGLLIWCYLDDLFIPGNNVGLDMVASLRQVLERCRQYGLFLKRSKCEFNVKRTNYLGFVVSSDGLEVPEKRRNQFDKIPLPTTASGLRTYLGMGNFLRRFLPRYAQMAFPLYMMTGGPKKKVLEWSEETKRSFQDIKEAVKSSVKLAWLKPKGGIHLFTDASEGAFGGWLGQDQGEIDENLKSILSIIAVFSKAFKESQRNWSITDKEQFAIFFGVETLHHLLAARSFTVHTDHAALFYTTVQSDSKRVQRMREVLGRYQITYVHIKGTDNVFADALSRVFYEDNVYPVEDAEIDEALEVINTYTLAGLSASYEEHTEELKKLPTLQYWHGTRGHYALDKTLATINYEGAQWPGYEQDLRKYIQKCTTCAENARLSQHFHGRQFILDGFRPGQVWSLDLIDVGEDYNGNKYILSLIDNFSRHLCLFPLQTKAAEEATYFIWSRICSEGPPEKIITDGGGEFSNSIMQSIVKFLKINNVTTSSGDSKANGICERVNGEVRIQLKKAFQERNKTVPTSWHWFLPTIAANHNNMVHKATGFPPNLFHSSKFHSSSIEEQEEQVRAVQHKIIQKESSKSSQLRYPEIQAGTSVYLMNSAVTKRNLSDTNWLGPYTVRGRVVDQVELWQVPGVAYNISHLKLA
jgi:hypothetical protein